MNWNIKNTQTSYRRVYEPKNKGGYLWGQKELNMQWNNLHQNKLHDVYSFLCSRNLLLSMENRCSV